MTITLITTCIGMGLVRPDAAATGVIITEFAWHFQAELIPSEGTMPL